MKVREKKKAPRQKGNLPSPRPVQTHTFPAPVRGWIMNENEAVPQPAGAMVLDNWFCTEKGIRTRRGSSLHVTLPSACISLFPFRLGESQSFFGATGTGIYDITTSGGYTGVPAVSGQTSGYYSHEQFGTTGGNFLYAVNGTDDAQLFDGTSWQAVNSTSSPISITDTDTSEFSQVWAFANRLFFVRSNTKFAYYLPTDSIGGAASQFSLAGVFKKGGSLLMGASWSISAGDGLGDKCVFISTEGEVAVYQGTNPSSAAEFELVGVYDITPPLGPNATMRAGGDLLVATVSGLVSINDAIRTDIAAISSRSVSAPIAPYWESQVSIIGPEHWEILKWPEKGMMVISQPNDASQTCLVANLKTGAWSRFTGWDTSCLALYDQTGFFGSQTGAVYRMETGGSDDGSNYTSVYLGQHEGMSHPGVQKSVLQVKATFRTLEGSRPTVSAQVDYSSEVGRAPDSIADTQIPTVWDGALWDVSVWDGGPSITTVSRWASVGRTGFVVAPEVQITSGVSTASDTELVSIDVTYDVGALVA